MKSSGILVRRAACAALVAWACSLGCGSRKPPPVPGANLDKLIRQGKLAEAQRVCRKLLDQDPDNADHRGNLAKVLCLRGDVLLAEAGFFDFDRAKAKEAKKSPKYRDALGCFEAATSEARLALKKAPKLASVRGTLGLALYRRGRAKEAIDELNRALVDDDRLARAHNTLGLIYHEQGKRDSARTHFQAALSLDGGLSEAAYNLAVFHEDELAELAEVEKKARAAGAEPPGETARRKAEARRAAVKYYRRYLKAVGARRKEVVRDRLKRMEGDKVRGAAPRAGPVTGGGSSS